MITAYVLIQAQVGRSAEVGSGVARIEGVISADVVTGPYDVIAMAETASMDDLGKLVAARIHASAPAKRLPPGNRAAGRRPFQLRPLTSTTHTTVLTCRTPFEARDVPVSMDPRTPRATGPLAARGSEQPTRGRPSPRTSRAHDRARHALHRRDA